MKSVWLAGEQDVGCKGKSRVIDDSLDFVLSNCIGRGAIYWDGRQEGNGFWFGKKNDLGFVMLNLCIYFVLIIIIKQQLDF